MIIRKLAFGFAAAALLISAAVSAAAVPYDALRVTAHQSFDVSAQDYRRRHRRHHHDRIDSGDIITGIGILAGIVILADSVRSSPPRRRGQQRDTQTNTDDMGNAINRCSKAAETAAIDGAKVSQIRNVSRNGPGWQVTGEMQGGGASGFLCLTQQGRVDYLQMDK
jgi:hypothetical protein